MIRKFLTPVPGQGLIEFIWQLLGLLDERGNDRLRVLVGHLRQHYVARVTFDQGRDIAVFRTGQEIALPMTGYCPIFNRCRPRTDGATNFVRSTQAHSGLQCPELAQLRPQIVPWSTLCRADWVRNDPVLTTRG